MILIADSGSTKTSWCCLSNKSNARFYSSEGINPYYRSSENIVNELKTVLLPKLPHKVDKVFFYGAGIVNREKGKVVSDAFAELFPNAKCELASDLLAAARATFRDQKGIACILGTGSNSCFYDGEGIIDQIPPLGFILGDEGSGAYLGKKLAGDYLKKIMPTDLRKKFNEKYPLKYEDFLEGVYRGDTPSRFLAGFVPFLGEHMDNEYCRSLVKNSFKEFLIRNVMQYPNCKLYPVCFVGSLAFYFQTPLKEALSECGLTAGLILKEPLESLVHYHLEK